jgi:ribosome-binding factor A
MTPLNYSRSDRVAKQIKKEIGDIFLREMDDPQFRLFTVTKIKMSKDLRYANIYYSVMGGVEQKEKSETLLQNAASQIRRELGHRIRLKFVPELRFFYDDSTEYAAHISELLDKINRKKH